MVMLVLTTCLTWSAPLDPNAKWDPQFTEPGLPGPVRAVVVDGADVYVGGDFPGGVLRWDGRGWSALGSGVNGRVSALVMAEDGLYVGGSFSQAGQVSARNVARWDGLDWAALGEGVDDAVSALAARGGEVFAGGNFRNAGTVGVRYIARWNGRSWAPLGDGASNGVNSAVEVITVGATGKVYAGGYFDEAGGLVARGVAVWDGATWKTLGSGLLLEGEYGSSAGRVFEIQIWGGEVYVGGEFNRAGSVVTTGIARWDGTTWSAVGGGVQGLPGSTDAHVRAMAVHSEGLFVAGQFLKAGTNVANGLALWDGVGWDPMLAPEDSAMGVNDLAVAGNGDLYLGGNFTDLGTVSTGQGIARYRDDRFQALGNGVQYDVYALAARDGKVYGGGRFFRAGGVYCRNVGRWTGSGWEALGEGANAGVNGIVHAVAVHPDGDVYAGGEFTEAGGIEARGLARWDGESWSAVGGGLAGVGGSDPLVYALHFAGTNLYVGGSFADADGLTVGNVARWDGVAWSALGTNGQVGVLGVVRALASRGGDLFVGGVLTRAGGQAAEGLARWDGEVWHPIGGLRAPLFEPVAVHALVVRGDELLVGGRFVIGAEGSETRHLAVWDGTSIQPLEGNPANSVLGYVDALVLSGGDLYVAGDFETAGGTAARSVARFDGQVWHALGSGVSGRVHAAAVSGGRLVVGGVFSVAGGKASVGLGQWTFLDATPRVVLTAPTEGARVEVGQPIPLRAELENVESGVQRVEFLDGLTLIEARTNAPYETVWMLASVGDHALSARAHVVGGEVLASGPAVITVLASATNLPPWISIVTPTNGAVATAGGPLELEAQAVDLDGSIERVEFWVDEVLVGTRHEPPYRLAVDGLAIGTHTLFARGFDQAGAAAESEWVGVTIAPANLPPSVEFFLPGGSVYELPEVPLFMARVHDSDGSIAGVEFYVDEQLLISLIPSAVSDIYRYSWGDATPGTYVPRAVAMDDRGARTEVALSAITVLAPNAPPVVEILSPTNGISLSQATNVTVTVEAEDPDGVVEVVRLFIGEAEVRRSTNAPFKLTTPVLTDGVFELRAAAEDENGKVGSSEVVRVRVATGALRYQVVDLSELLATGESHANAVNGQGTVAGDFFEGNTAHRGFTVSTSLVWGTSAEVLPLPSVLPPNLGPGVAWASGINDHGEVVGAATTTNGFVHAVWHRGGEVLDLGTLAGGEGESQANGINTRGEIVGQTRTAEGHQLAFVYRDSRMTSLGSLGFPESSATAINDAGTIVGVAFTAAGSYQAFRYELGFAELGMTNLGARPPEFPFSRALGVNNSGQVVGNLENSFGVTRAFLLEAGVLEDLGTLGGTLSGANAINDHGLIVGHSRDYDGEPHACLWQGGLAYDLNHLIPTNAGWRLQEARAINECGAIVGFGNRTNRDERHGFLLMPLPPLTVLGPPELDRQTGLLEQRLQLSNPGPAPLCGLRLVVDGLPTRAVIQNATVQTNGRSWIEVPGPVPAGSNLLLTVEFYVPSRQSEFSPEYALEIARVTLPLAATNATVAIRRVVTLPGGEMMIEFLSQTNRLYQVQYSDDLLTWKRAYPDLKGNGTRLQWVDNGPPKTEPLPFGATNRFYRLYLDP